MRTLAILLQVLASAAFAEEAEERRQRAMHGVVRAASGEAVAGARVRVVGRPGIEATTDAEGRFEIALAEGELLSVEAAGFATLPPQTLPADGVLRLDAALALEESVLVHAPPDDSVASTVEHEAIIRSGALTGTEVVAALPGGSSSGRGGSYNVPTLRALARGRTLVMVGDARVGSERRAGPGISFVPPAFMERVTALRGPLAAQDGSDAIAGSVVFDLREPKADADPHFEALLEGAPHGFGVSLVGQAAGSHWRGLAGAVHRNYDDYPSPDTGDDVADTGLEGLSMMTRVVRDGKRSRFDLALLHHSGEDIGRADSRYPLRESSNPHDRWSLADVRWTMQVRDDAMVQVSGTWLGSDVATRNEVYRADGSLSRTEDARDTASDFNVRAAFAKEWAKGDLRAGIDALSRGSLKGENEIASYPANGDPPTVRSEVPLDGGSNRDLGAFVGGGFELGGDVRALAGVRWDTIRTDADDQEAREESDWSGHAGLRWRENRKFGMAFLAGRAFRSPGVYQLFYSGLTGRGRIHANPDLPQESAQTLDFALFGTTAKCRWEARAFRIDLDDFVDRVSVGDDFFWESLDSARIDGVEVAASVQLPAGWTFETTAQRLRGRDETTDKPLNDVPAHRIILRGDWAGERYRAGMSAELMDNIDDPGPEEREVPGAALLDGYFGFRINDRLDLSFRIDNILDQTAYPTADEMGVSLPGRVASLALTLRVP